MDHTKLAHVLAHMKYLTVDGKELFMPEKVYKNPTWMNSSVAKQLRIMSEIIEPDQRLAAAGVHKSILFFGSARAKSEEDHAAASAKAAATLASAGASEADKEKARISLGRLSKTAWMCDVYVQVEQLARKLTEWSMGRIGATGAGVPYIISTGGGPGLMEAANRGASSVPGAITAGIAISLPFEQGINRFVTVSRAAPHQPTTTTTLERRSNAALRLRIVCSRSCRRAATTFSRASECLCMPACRSTPTGSAALDFSARRSSSTHSRGVVFSSS